MPDPLDVPTPFAPFLPDISYFDWTTDDGIYRYHVVIKEDTWNMSGGLQVSVLFQKRKYHHRLRYFGRFCWTRVWRVKTTVTLPIENTDTGLQQQIKVAFLNSRIRPSDLLLVRCTGILNDYGDRKQGGYNRRDELVNRHLKIRSIK